VRNMVWVFRHTPHFYIQIYTAVSPRILAPLLFLPSHLHPSFSTCIKTQHFSPHTHKPISPSTHTPCAWLFLQNSQLTLSHTPTPCRLSPETYHSLYTQKHLQFSTHTHKHAYSPVSPYTEINPHCVSTSKHTHPHTSSTNTLTFSSDTHPISTSKFTLQSRHVYLHPCCFSPHTYTPVSPHA